MGLDQLYAMLMCFKLAHNVVGAFYKYVWNQTFRVVSKSHWPSAYRELLAQDRLLNIRTIAVLAMGKLFYM